MKILDFEAANCKNCYKCVRNCSVKAIKMIDDRAQIDENLCIACGNCLLVCPQNARYIRSELDKLFEAIEEGKQIVLSIAPSYLGIFKEPYKFIASLRSIGINIIEETSIGAEKVSSLYKEYLDTLDNKSVITTCCPSANQLIEHYFPELISNMIPVVSPMVAHCKMLKEKYNENSFIAFLGPCIAKKSEKNLYEAENFIDTVITFEEIEDYFEQNGIEINTFDDSKPDSTGNTIGQQYPMENGIIDGLRKTLKSKGYIPLSISGVENCKKAFESLKDEHIEKLFIEVNTCTGSCIGGPAISKHDQNVNLREYLIRNKLSENTLLEKIIEEKNNPINYTKIFTDKSVNRIYKEKDIKAVLAKTGKHKKEDELNCGACGYNTCREKAMAVLDGLAKPEMCLPYMRSKAERISNIAFEYSPNILFIVDHNLDILDMNPLAETSFSASKENFIGKNLSLLMPTEAFGQVIERDKNLLNKKFVIEKYNLITYISIIYLEKLKSFFVMLLDITEEEKENEKLIEMKMKTINAADKVIEKQMRVAQEIAGLLGETTAETKATLLKLKKVVATDESER